MTDLLVGLPVLVPIGFAAVSLLAWRAPRIQRAFCLGGLGTLLVAAVLLFVAVVQSGPLTLSVGGWQSPVGISFRADLLGATMTLVAAFVGVAAGTFAFANTPDNEARRGFWPLVLLLVMSVCGALLTADIFNLFVWFEVMLISSFVLLALGGERRQLAGAHVYLVLNLLGSTIFLITVGVIYGSVHTLDLDQLAHRARVLAEVQPGLVLAIHVLLLISFGLKAAVFPVMFWLPASYHTPRPVVSALFAALLTKVGVYAMLRTAGVLPTDATIPVVLAFVAMPTMLVGVLGAYAQGSLRRLLSFHIVSQIGYMVAGVALAVGTEAQQRFALAITIFYVVNQMLVKTNLFLVAGIVRRRYGSEALSELGGLGRMHPYLAALFLLSALSLAGVPPLSGFWAKLGVVQAGLDHGAIALVVVALVTSLLTLLSMMKIWFGVFTGTPTVLPAAKLSRAETWTMYGGATLLAAGTLLLSVAPGTLLAVAFSAADQLLALGGAR